MSDGSIIIDTLLETKDFKKDLGKFDSLIEKGMKGATVALGAITAGLGFATKEVLNFGIEYNKASNSLQAETGATAEEMETLNNIMKNTYANNYGESMEDVANAVALVNKELGYFETEEEMQRATENALALRDTFEYEVNESVRSASTLMGIFAMNSDEAFTLIAQGAQRGLDYSGELLDSVNEYSVQFNKLGLDAEDMFNIFESGMTAGAFNLDKIGDAVKEFSIRAIDGSNTTVEGFKKIGLNADTMAKKFAQGGDVAKEAFYDVIKRIREMDNKVEQSIVGVDLFGTMWEDLGPEVITQLDGIQDAYDSTADTMAKINEVKYNDVGSALEGLKRNLQTNILLPISDKIMPAINKLVNKFSQVFKSDKMKKSIEKISDSISKFAERVAETAEKWLPKLIDVLAWVLEHGTGIAGSILAVTTAIKTISKINSAIETIKSFNDHLNKAKETSANSSKVLSNLKGSLSTVVSAVGLVAIAYEGYNIAQSIFLEKTQKELEGINSITEAIKENAEARNNARTSIDEEVTANLNEIKYIEDLKNELDTLIDSKGKVKEADQARADFIINELNGALGTEIKLNNGVVQSYQSISENIDKMIEKKKTQIAMEALEEKSREAIKNKSQDYENLKTAQENVTEAQRKYNEILGKAPIYGVAYKKSIDEAKTSLDNAQIALDTAKDAYAKDLVDIQAYTDGYILNQQGKYDELYNMTTSIYSNVTESMAKSIQDQTNKIEELTPELQQAWKLLAEKSGADYEKALSGVTDKGTRKAIESIVNQTNSNTSVQSSANGLGQDYTQGLKNGVESKKWILDSSIAGIGMLMISKLKNVLGIHSPSTEGNSIGVYFLQGILNGVNNNGKLSSIYSRIASIGMQMLQKLKSALGIHSPSKETKQDGIYFVEGIINGLIAKERKVYNAVSSLGYGLTDEFANSFNAKMINSNIEDLYSKMQSTIDFETSKLNSNLTTTATVNRAITVSIMAKGGDVYMDKQKVARIITPEISKNIKYGGAY